LARSQCSSPTFTPPLRSYPAHESVGGAQPPHWQSPSMSASLIGRLGASDFREMICASIKQEAKTSIIEIAGNCLKESPA
jgi:hypothetical protein